MIMKMKLYLINNSLFTLFNNSIIINRMDWQPKYIEIRMRARQVQQEYERGKNPKLIASSLGITLGSVYRYLKTTKTKLRGLRQDEKTGRFLKNE